MLNRREILLATASSLLLVPRRSNAESRRQSVIRDYSRLDAIQVANELRPRSTEEVSEYISNWQGPISIGGGRFSMGGQIAAPESLHLDM